MKDLRARTPEEFLSAVGEEAVLTVLARKEAKLGLVFLDMKRAAEDLARLI